MDSNHSHNRIGDITEVSLASQLMAEGWEVFRNMGSDGPVDMIALNPFTGEVRYIDAKRPSITPKGKWSMNNRYSKELAIEVEYLAHQYETGETRTAEDLANQEEYVNVGGLLSRKKISVNGIVYDSLTDASKAVDISTAWLSSMARDPKKESIYYV